ncbi:hypothetical protein GUITHDRAFT_148723 [Guillardia theta CCMP2712]|uniref:Uncharacterized protein n=1 Tax=Guillardia theta (strain CCMP2712) TaxID=905079 RepID=L1I7S9_GUITC|nr:hypothetical protein GUITHDRAFT_148723 [Guillardia theta CCMP2712]EKX32301.1 hypothetical protein GUITHDRAFT_148723 [Guillardia theta CCMP2712]|eukprot:XP_005819281.1 hypothetical protein GUITHDRAFT_148723 [Guillardia theta CCMP2712]
MVSFVSTFSRPAVSSLARRALAAAKPASSSRSLSTLVTSSQSILLDDTAEPALWQCLPEWCKEHKKYNQVFVLGDSVSDCEAKIEKGRPAILGSFASSIEKRRRRFLIARDPFWGK